MRSDARTPRLRTALAVATLGLEEYLDYLDEVDAARLLPVTPWRASCRRLLRTAALD